MTSLEMVGRFAELERAAEKKLANQAQPDTSTLAPLCLAYARLKKYRQLASCLDQLDQRVRAGDTTIVTDRADISNSDATPFAGMLRAEAAVELGDYGKAIDEAKAALGRIQDRMPFGAWPPKIYRLSITGTLGLAYALAGDKPNALAQIKALEDFPIGFLGWGSLPSYRDNGIARIYAALGDYARALHYLKDEGQIVKFAFALNNAAWGFSGSDAVETYIALPKLLFRGLCLLETGDLAGAKTYLDTVLHNDRIGDFGDLYWIALYERGRIAEKEARPDEAIPFYQRAIEVIERQRASISTEANKIGYVGDKQQVYGRLVAALVSQGRAAEAFDYVERSKSRALVDMLAGKRDFVAPGVAPQRLNEVLGQLDAADMAVHVQNGMIQAQGASGAGGLRKLELAQQEIQGAAPELATLVTVGAVPADELGKLIGNDEALVEYYYQGSDLYAFVLNHEGLRAIKLAGEGMEEQVRALRTAIEQAGDEWETAARGLYARLWQPIEGALGAPKSVVLVAHGALHYLPFAALRRPDGSFLIDQYGLRFLPSASVLKFLRPARTDKAAPMLALGNPDLGNPKLDLQFAEGEARAVGELFPEARVLVRGEASETNFKKAGPAFQRIHFATHGRFQADNPLSSGLYLAKDAENDGLLTVGELYSMSIGADLVTLSACETGLGKVANGDDVVGLTRGFLYAGSRSVLASLWSIDDNATAELMKAFYRNRATLNKEEALRQAQIAIRRSFPNPFFWAAFQLTGSAD